MKCFAIAIFALSTAVFATRVWAASASDDASEPTYADGWDDGDNGGPGFGPWTLSFDGDANALDSIYGPDPHFIDGVDVEPLASNLLGSPTFGLTADYSISTKVQATRSINMPLKVGQTFYVDIDGSALEGTARIGNLFELVGEDGVPRYSLRTSLASVDEHWTLNGTDTAIDASDAFRVTVTLTSDDTFSGSVSSHTQPVGTFSLNAPLTGTSGAAINGLRFLTSGTGSSSDGAREMFFNNLKITDTVPEPVSLLLAISMATACLGYKQR